MVRKAFQVFQEKVAMAPVFAFEVVTIERIERKGLFGLGGQKIITISQKSRAEYRIEDLGNGVKLELVSIPGGRFAMGAPNNELNACSSESPQHNVTVQPLLIGKFQVTQSQWNAVARFAKIKDDLNTDPSNFKGENLPVEEISWHEAIEFCARLSQRTKHAYRLPSEAEWEYACRAGTSTPFHFGETITPDLANYEWGDTYGSARKRIYRDEPTTTKVGSFSANAFGLYDMHGNVWEWCADHWHMNYEGAPTDGSAWLSEDQNTPRLLRGGSWLYNPGRCRSAARTRDPSVRSSDIGFRICCSAKSTESGADPPS